MNNLRKQEYNLYGGLIVFSHVKHDMLYDMLEALVITEWLRMKMHILYRITAV